MRFTGRLAAGAVVLAACLTVAVGVAPRADAQAALPYVAYGSGLAAGQVVEAFVEGASVGRTTADASGRWKIQVEPDSAKSGDHIVFHVDGTATDKSTIFESGRFPLPPGIALGVSSVAGRATATPVPGAVATPTLTPRPTATPRTKPAVVPRPASCTRNGRPIPCTPSRPAPPALPTRR